MIKPFISALLIVLTGLSTFAQSEQKSSQTLAIQNFLVQENLLKNSKIAVIAADTADRPDESLNGSFMFSINGFQQELKFNDGVAVAPQAIDKSTFLYIRHQNENGTLGKLFYVYKSGDHITPYKISWWVLVLVPLIIILLAYLFKRFIIIAAILLILILIFNSRNGLGIPTFFDTIFDGLKQLVAK